jgi:cytochrome c oxidase subunit 2
MRLIHALTGLMAVIFANLTALAASAQEVIVGAPEDKALGFQPAATELARDLQFLDSFLLIIISVITVFVVGLLAIVILRYNKWANKTPASWSHNSPLEVTWTIMPIIILLFIGAFSLPILFKQQEIPEADIVVKATGYQWYWGYEYPDDGILFDSIMIGAGENRLTPEVEEELVDAGYSKDEFLLAVDNAMVVPVGKTIVVQVTAADVIHSWTVPSFGVKQDGVPGRLAELWFKAEAEGVYFGQCSELCGIAHAYMPIAVKVVSEAEYAEWLDYAKEEFAAIEPAYQVASN